MIPPLEQIYETIQQFLAEARQPAVVEPGTLPIPIEKDSCLVDLTGGRLTLQAWTADRNLVRRITGITADTSGRLDLSFERFGRQTGTLQLIDLAKPRNQNVTRRAARLTYREQFRRSLLRQFPGAVITDLSTDPDLQRTFSPAYARALVRHGSTALAAMGVPPDQLNPDGVLSFGLIWLDHLRARERRTGVRGLALFLPEGKQRNVCLRLLHLADSDVDWSVFVYGEDFEHQVDLRDYGNVDTSLPVARTGLPLPEWAQAVGMEPGVETVLLSGGGVSWRVNGLQFAYFDGTRVEFGIETPALASASNLPEILALGRELLRRRSPDTVDRRSPLFLRDPESWLESRVRSGIVDIDASLLPTPVYGQVPAMAAGERGVLDLLACDFAGRLAVVEVKVTEDLHLPLQALDYWIRVKWHLDRDEFTTHGFFPGIALQKRSPRMLLVAPALNFHPATESILRYFPPDLDVHRIGVTMDWQRGLDVAFRARGGASPAAQMWNSPEPGGA